MTVPGLAVRALDELPARREAGVDWLTVRHAFGIRAFGINAWRGARGAEVIERHDEDEHEELYVVVRGAARFEVGGETVEAPAGTFVFVQDPVLERVATALEADTVVLSVGGPPGRAFEVSDWERRELALDR
jgi:quercetin dioxygenase-like cupin family protein